jgi:hypothetical protein
MPERTELSKAFCLECFGWYWDNYARLQRLLDDPFPFFCGYLTKGHGSSFSVFPLRNPERSDGPQRHGVALGDTALSVVPPQSEPRNFYVFLVIISSAGYGAAQSAVLIPFVSILEISIGGLGLFVPLYRKGDLSFI